MTDRHPAFLPRHKGFTGVDEPDPDHWNISSDGLYVPYAPARPKFEIAFEEPSNIIRDVVQQIHDEQARQSGWKYTPDRLLNSVRVQRWGP